jgi:hypothetical protein
MEQRRSVSVTGAAYCDEPDLVPLMQIQCDFLAVLG